MTNASNTAAPEGKKKNKSTWLIIFLVLIILAQWAKIYYDSQEKKATQSQLASTEEELASTMQRLEEIKTELDQKIAEIQKLGGDITELQKAKEEVEKQLASKTKATGKLIKELRSKVEGYEELLKLKDEEIEKLKSVNKELLTENTTLKTEKNQLGDSINRLEKKKSDLQSKVLLASQLKAENFRILAISEKNKERESPFRARQIEKIKVEFSLAENKVAPIEGKKIMIRIVDENGKVIFDVARGSGTFIFNGKEEFYTASQEILFDNTKQKLVYLYDKGSEYSSGIYQVEVYTDDYLMGKGTFEVK
ncbi:MAG: chromosome segregation protein SMC [Cyclobacteriaceae bacterium]|jgi:chromosome segregation ATPase|nr:chromosome segregation protein SMC [Flammeovirgaceae bacterium]MCZ8022362.1 chromosome segregation protein SMC [Cytophagales bacterium]MCZ8327446.1 chromosome segregation protein SMC [Cyclobacteriaceae bacterium]